VRRIEGPSVEISRKVDERRGSLQVIKPLSVRKKGRVRGFYKLLDGKVYQPKMRPPGHVQFEGFKVNTELTKLALVGEYDLHALRVVPAA
jgi:hypothetical protein